MDTGVRAPAAFALECLTARNSTMYVLKRYSDDDTYKYGMCTARTTTVYMHVPFRSQEDGNTLSHGMESSEHSQATHPHPNSHESVFALPSRQRRPMYGKSKLLCETVLHLNDLGQDKQTHPLTQTTSSITVDTSIISYLG